MHVWPSHRLHLVRENHHNCVQIHACESKTSDNMQTRDIEKYIVGMGIANKYLQKDKKRKKLNTKTLTANYKK